MTELPYPHQFHLEAAEGWLMLGNAIEAKNEFEKITGSVRQQPDLLEFAWGIYAALNDWENSLTISRECLRLDPKRAFGWIHHAYALRRAATGGLPEAWKTLLAAVSLFPENTTIPYNLACYACQMGNLPEAWSWLRRAMRVAGSTGARHRIRNMALCDPDLEPMWSEIKELPE